MPEILLTMSKETGVQRLKKFRVALGLSQIELAQRLDLRQGSISDIERGKVGLSPNILIKLETVFGANRDWFLSGKRPEFLDGKGLENAKEKIESASEIIENVEKHPHAAEPSPQYGPSEQVWKSAFESMAAAMKMLTDTNEDVLESNKLFRKMISAWMDKGALIMDNKKAGMKQD